MMEQFKFLEPSAGIYLHHQFKIAEASAAHYLHREPGENSQCSRIWVLYPTSLAAAYVQQLSAFAK
jgi:hypothetical protein